MKRISFSLATILLLTACSTQQTVKYRLDFDVTDKDDQQMLLTTSQEVIERRLAHLGKQMVSKTVEIVDGKPVLLITLPDGDTAKQLTEELTAPFDLTVMGETLPGEKADTTIENRGSYTKSGITEDDFEWVEARKDPNSNKGEVGLKLTEAGQVKIRDLFKRMKGKSIGIFVRGKLVSLLNVQTDDVPKDLIIHDVPSADIAQIFADDMDTGLHVTFTPVP